MQVIDFDEHSKDANSIEATAAKAPVGRNGYLASLSLIGQYVFLWIFVWMKY
jgi:hypothetical protein